MKILTGVEEDIGKIASNLAERIPDYKNMRGMRHLTAFMGLLAAGYLFPARCQEAQEPDIHEIKIRPTNISAALPAHILSENRNVLERRKLPEMTDLKIEPGAYVPIADSDLATLLGAKEKDRNSLPDECKDNDLEQKTKQRVRKGFLRSNLVSLVYLRDCQIETGSGIYITPRHIITNHHVVKEYAMNGGALYSLSFPPDGKMRQDSVKVVAYSEKRDIAMCVVDQDCPGVEVLTLSPARPRRGERLIGIYQEFPEKRSAAPAAITSPEDKVSTSVLDGLIFNLMNEKLNITYDNGVRLIVCSGNACFSGNWGYTSNLEETAVPILKTGRDTPIEYPIAATLKANHGNSGTAVFGFNEGRLVLVGPLATGSPTTNFSFVVAPETLIQLLQAYKQPKGNK